MYLLSTCRRMGSKPPNSQDGFRSERSDRTDLEGRCAVTMTEPRAAVGDKPNQPKLSDRALKRLVILGGVALVVLVAAFSVIYFLGEHVSAGPSLAHQRVAAAEADVRAAPSNIELRLALARTYQAVSRPDDAISQYTQVLKVVPNAEAALVGRAAIYFQKNSLQLAKADYSALVTLVNKGELAATDPPIEAAHYSLAVIATKANDWTTAGGELKVALGIDKTDSDAWFLVGQVALHNTAPQSAVYAFNKALSFVPTGWCDPYVGLATAYQKLSDQAHLSYVNALNDLCHMRIATGTSELTNLTTGPVAVEAMLQLGALAQSQSDPAVATIWYKKVLAKDPSNASALAALSRLSANMTQSAGN
jgi:tetratricopeptide (TPR) repeat protein